MLQQLIYHFNKIIVSGIHYIYSEYINLCAVTVNSIEENC